MITRVYAKNQDTGDIMLYKWDPKENPDHLLKKVINFNNQTLNQITGPYWTTSWYTSGLLKTEDGENNPWCWYNSNYFKSVTRYRTSQEWRGDFIIKNGESQYILPYWRNYDINQDFQYSFFTYSHKLVGTTQLISTPNGLSFNQKWPYELAIMSSSNGYIPILHSNAEKFEWEWQESFQPPDTIFIRRRIEDSYVDVPLPQEISTFDFQCVFQCLEPITVQGSTSLNDDIWNYLLVTPNIKQDSSFHYYQVGPKTDDTSNWNEQKISYIYDEDNPVTNKNYSIQLYHTNDGRKYDYVGEIEKELIRDNTPIIPKIKFTLSNSEQKLLVYAKELENINWTIYLYKVRGESNTLGDDINNGTIKLDINEWRSLKRTAPKYSYSSDGFKYVEFWLNPSPLDESFLLIIKGGQFYFIMQFELQRTNTTWQVVCSQVTISPDSPT